MFNIILVIISGLGIGSLQASQGPLVVLPLPANNIITQAMAVELKNHLTENGGLAAFGLLTGSLATVGLSWFFMKEIRKDDSEVHNDRFKSFLRFKLNLAYTFASASATIAVASAIMLIRRRFALFASENELIDYAKSILDSFFNQGQSIVLSELFLGKISEDSPLNICLKAYYAIYPFEVGAEYFKNRFLLRKRF